MQLCRAYSCVSAAIGARSRALCERRTDADCERDADKGRSSGVNDCRLRLAPKNCSSKDFVALRSSNVSSPYIGFKGPCPSSRAIDGRGDDCLLALRRRMDPSSPADDERRSWAGRSMCGINCPSSGLGSETAKAWALRTEGERPRKLPDFESGGLGEMPGLRRRLARLLWLPHRSRVAGLVFRDEVDDVAR